MIYTCVKDDFRTSSIAGNSASLNDVSDLATSCKLFPASQHNFRDHMQPPSSPRHQRAPPEGVSAHAYTSRVTAASRFIAVLPVSRTNDVWT